MNSIWGRVWLCVVAVLGISAGAATARAVALGEGSGEESSKGGQCKTMTQSCAAANEHECYEFAEPITCNGTEYAKGKWVEIIWYGDCASVSASSGGCTVCKRRCAKGQAWTVDAQGRCQSAVADCYGYRLTESDKCWVAPQ